MTNIIRFRTREEWEQEKKEKVLVEWKEYLVWEEEILRIKAAEEKTIAQNTGGVLTEEFPGTHVKHRTFDKEN